MVFTAGNKGDSVRSDCWVSLSLNESSGIQLKIDSKVTALYGKSIKEQCLSVLEYFEIKDAYLTIEDKGALPFVLISRLESVIKKAIDTDTAFLPEINLKTTIPSTKKQNRTSRLYLPGNTPKLMVNAGIYNSSGIILDLEDSVHPDKKDEARVLVRNALRVVDFKESERMVRINQLPLGFKDLESIIPQKPNLVLLPKCESAEQVKQADECISGYIDFNEFPIYIMPIIESALGITNVYEIATASKRNVALAIGLEDYTADIGVERTNEGLESFYARSAVVTAAKAAGIQPIDSVFSDIDDMDALATNIKISKSLGFVGMGCIHPRQVVVINKEFAPSLEEINKAKRIVNAFDEAEKQGLGVVSLGSKMIDPPVVERAQHIINTAIDSGVLIENWRAEHGE